MEPRVGRGGGTPGDHDASSTVENGRIARLAFTQKDPTPRRGLVWTAADRGRARLRRDDSTHSGHVERARVDVAPARGLPAPLFVLPNGGGIAYGGFELDAASRAYLLASPARTFRDALTRGSAWVTLWDDMLDGRSRAADVVEDLHRGAAARARRAEPAADAVATRSRASGGSCRRRTATRCTPRLERVLRAGLDRAPRRRA